MDEIKRALVLSGGGSFGAWQAGACTALIGPHQPDYDMIAGISVGAINGGWLSAGPQKDQIGPLIEHWESVTTRKVRRKPLGFPLSILWTPSVYSSAPLEEWIRDLFDGKDPGSHTPFRCGMVNMETGEYFAPQRPTVDDILASASFPGFLSPVHTRGAWHFDGGVRHVSPVGTAIQMGATHLDIVLCSSIGLARKKPKKTIPTLLRALEIMQDQLVRDDLRLCSQINHNPGLDQRVVKFRVITPTKLVGRVLTFEPADVRENLSQGLLDGSKLLNMEYRI